MAESVRLLGGVALMLVGVMTVITAVFRALGDNWPLRGHQRWALPAAGLGLCALGRWMIS